MNEDNVVIGAGCLILIFWAIGALVSLGVSVAFIYFLFQAASGNVF